MSGIALHKISTAAPDACEANVLFLHGLGGDHKETWMHNESTGFWPTWLSEDFPVVGVYSLGYDAQKIFWPNSDSANMPLNDRCSQIIDYLVSNEIQKKPLIIVCHSLGGIIAKQILKRCADVTDEKWQLISKNTIGVIFLACPHDGAELATVAKLLTLPIIEQNKLIEILVKDGDQIRELKSWYSENADKNGHKTKAYFESKGMAIGLVVSKSSADPGVKGCIPVAVDGDHITICKPSSRTEPVYMGVKTFIEECLDNRDDSATDPQIDFLDREIEKYKTQVDRRTLDEKLCDAGRDYEIKDAKRKKENFDKEFRKNSLQSSAKKKYALLLGEVESRFHRHVYPLLAEGADIAKVNQAVQQYVVDPIVSQFGASENVNAGTIDEMIFYLTGQCNIRWHHG